MDQSLYNRETYENTEYFLKYPGFNDLSINLHTPDRQPRNLNSTPMN